MTIKAFGYLLRIHLFRKKGKNLLSPSQGFVSSGVKLVCDKKFIYLVDSQDQPFRNQISCTIKDGINRPTVVTIKAHVQSIEYKEDI